ncbi:hypothetical protein AYP72_10955 [Ligilactobacillus agilis]|nr:hypothetical protein AYP72_10955 [Ligilactobacillus agilis]
MLQEKKLYHRPLKTLLLLLSKYLSSNKSNGIRLSKNNDNLLDKFQLKTVLLILSTNKISVIKINKP